MKVLRVWLDGQSTDQKVFRPYLSLFVRSSQVYVTYRQGTTINPFPDLEPTQICNGTESCYDDTVLDRLDTFMLAAHDYGIKVVLLDNSFISERPLTSLPAHH